MNSRHLQIASIAIAFLLPLASCGGSEPSTSERSEQQSQQAQLQELNRLIESTPKQASVNLSNYNRLEEGMSVAQVEEILGPGTKVLDSVSDGSTFEAYFWKGTAEYSAVDVQFRSGQLSHKQQHDLR